MTDLTDYIYHRPTKGNIDYDRVYKAYMQQISLDIGIPGQYFPTAALDKIEIPLKKPNILLLLCN